ncbi:unnamed protein product, partial [Prunus brigantina]
AVGLEEEKQIGAPKRRHVSSSRWKRTGMTSAHANSKFFFLPLERAMHADVILPSGCSSGETCLWASPSSWVPQPARTKVACWNWIFRAASPQPRAWAPRWNSS